MQRLNAVNVEGVDVVGVVGVGKGAALAGAQPLVLFAERYDVVEVLDRGVCLYHASGGGCRDGSRRNGDLLVVRDRGT